MLFVLVPCLAFGYCISCTWFAGLRVHGLVRRHRVPQCGRLSSHPLPLLFHTLHKLGQVGSLRMLSLSSRLLSHASPSSCLPFPTFFVVVVGDVFQHDDAERYGDDCPGTDDADD